MKVINVVLVSKEADYFTEFSSALAGTDSLKISSMKSGAAVLEAVGGNDVDVVVVAEAVAEGSGLDLIKQLIMKNPFINTALVSALPHEAFHEVTEGLGVFMQLPPEPGNEDAVKFFEFLARIY